MTRDAALRQARAAVAALAPLTEAEAWEAAQTDPYGILSASQRDALEDLDLLDWFATGRSRGCHYGACNDREIDTSWRAP